MRLLNIHTRKFKKFDLASAPPYAIASHRWGHHEATFQDIWEQKRHAGCKKVWDYCAAVSALNQIVQQSASWKALGYSLRCEWLWIDTACIDRRNHSELSESINSMFSWYRTATVCYAYLPDVRTIGDYQGAMLDFLKSEWFTRGWTLQELLAPGVVVFMTVDWKVLGHKCPYDKPLCDLVCRGFGQRLDFVLSRITGIPLAAIRNYANSASCSTEEKLTWLSERITTRIEDRAYCMLGICDVFMSPIYGEGERAWSRLLAAIQAREAEESLTHSGLRWQNKSKSSGSGPLPRLTQGSGHNTRQYRESNSFNALDSPTTSAPLRPASPTARKITEQITVTSRSSFSCGTDSKGGLSSDPSTSSASSCPIARTARTTLEQRSRLNVIWDATINACVIPRGKTTGAVTGAKIFGHISSLPAHLLYPVSHRTGKFSTVFSPPLINVIDPVMAGKWARPCALDSLPAQCGYCYGSLYSSPCVLCVNAYCRSPVFHQRCTDWDREQLHWRCISCRPQQSGDQPENIKQIPQAILPDCDHSRSAEMEFDVHRAEEPFDADIDNKGALEGARGHAKHFVIFHGIVEETTSQAEDPDDSASALVSEDQKCARSSSNQEEDVSQNNIDVLRKALADYDRSKDQLARLMALLEEKSSLPTTPSSHDNSPVISEEQSRSDLNDLTKVGQGLSVDKTPDRDPTLKRLTRFATIRRPRRTTSTLLSSPVQNQPPMELQRSSTIRRFSKVFSLSHR